MFVYMLIYCAYVKNVLILAYIFFDKNKRSLIQIDRNDGSTSKLKTSILIT